MDNERIAVVDQNWAEMRKFIPHLYTIVEKLNHNKKLGKEEMVLVRKCVAMVLLRCDEMVSEIADLEDQP